VVYCVQIHTGRGETTVGKTEYSVIHFNPHREAEQQLEVACRMLAELWDRLPFYGTLAMFRDIATETGLPEEVLQDLYKKIFDVKTDSQSSTTRVWTRPQTQEMLDQLTTAFTKERKAQS